MGQQQSGENVEEGGQSAPTNPNPETTWWCRLLGRVVGCIAGGVAIMMGVWTCISFKPLCIVAGVIQILAGCVVLIFEAPICCSFIEKTKPIADWADRRSYFHKAIIYGVISLPEIVMCFGISTIFGAGLIFATGVLYGLMALGKKADRQTMIDQAQEAQGTEKTQIINQDYNATPQ